MATLAEMRAMLRNRLEDTGASPLFADAVLNDFLGRATEVYGRWVPKAATANTAASVTAGSTSFALPAAVGESAVVAIRDGSGADVRPSNQRIGPAPASSGGSEQAFRVWGQTVRLQRAVGTAEAGTWQVDYLAPRVAQTVDANPVDVVAGDEPIVIELAVAAAYDRRAFEDNKRGSDTDSLLEQAQAARDRAAWLFRQSNRRAVMGWVDVG